MSIEEPTARAVLMYPPQHSSSSFEWTLIQVDEAAAPSGVGGYAVLDALGVRIGRVTGWVLRPSGSVALLIVSVRDWFKTRDFFVPPGCISSIRDEAQQLLLRQLTKRALIKHCLPFAGALPGVRAIEDLIRFFPNPRPTVVERLAVPDDAAPPLPAGRLTVQPDQGDGMPFLPIFASDLPGASWERLERLAPPPWKPLSRFTDDTPA